MGQDLRQAREGRHAGRHPAASVRPVPGHALPGGHQGWRITSCQDESSTSRAWRRPATCSPRTPRSALHHLLAANCRGLSSNRCTPQCGIDFGYADRVQHLPRRSGGAPSAELNEERARPPSHRLISTAQQLSDSPSALAVRESAGGCHTGRQEQTDITCAWCLKRESRGEADCYQQAGRQATHRAAHWPWWQHLPRHAEPDGAAHSVHGSALTTSGHSTVHYARCRRLVSWTPAASNHYCREVWPRRLSAAVREAARRRSRRQHRVPSWAAAPLPLASRLQYAACLSSTVTLTDVCLVPGLATNLVSVARLTVGRPQRQLLVYDHAVHRSARPADRRSSPTWTRPTTCTDCGLRMDGAADSRPASCRRVAPRPQHCLAAGEDSEAKQLPPSMLWHQRLGHVNHRAVSHATRAAA